MTRKGCKFCGEDNPCGNDHCPWRKCNHGSSSYRHFSFTLGGEVEHKLQQDKKVVESGLVKTAENRQ